MICETVVSPLMEQTSSDLKYEAIRTAISAASAAALEAASRIERTPAEAAEVVAEAVMSAWKKISGESETATDRASD